MAKIIKAGLVPVNSLSQLRNLCENRRLTFLVVDEEKRRSTVDIRYYPSSKTFSLYHQIDATIESLTSMEMRRGYIGIAIRNNKLWEKK